MLGILEDKVEVPKVILAIMIKVIGKMSLEDLVRCAGEIDGNLLNRWYFDNRSNADVT